MRGDCSRKTVEGAFSFHALSLILSEGISSSTLRAQLWIDIGAMDITRRYYEDLDEFIKALGRNSHRRRHLPFWNLALGALANLDTVGGGIVGLSGVNGGGVGEGSGSGGLKGTNDFSSSRDGQVGPNFGRNGALSSLAGRVVYVTYHTSPNSHIAPMRSTTSDLPSSNSSSDAEIMVASAIFAPSLIVVFCADDSLDNLIATLVYAEISASHRNRGGNSASNNTTASSSNPSSSSSSAAPGTSYVASSGRYNTSSNNNNSNTGYSGNAASSSSSTSGSTSSSVTSSLTSGSFVSGFASALHLTTSSSAPSLSTPQPPNTPTMPKSFPNLPPSVRALRFNDRVALYGSLAHVRSLLDLAAAVARDPQMAEQSGFLGKSSPTSLRRLIPNDYRMSRDDSGMRVLGRDLRVSTRPQNIEFCLGPATFKRRTRHAYRLFFIASERLEAIDRAYAEAATNALVGKPTTTTPSSKKRSSAGNTPLKANPDALKSLRLATVDDWDALKSILRRENPDQEPNNEEDEGEFGSYLFASISSSKSTRTDIILNPFDHRFHFGGIAERKRLSMGVCASKPQNRQNGQTEDSLLQCVGIPYSTPAGAFLCRDR